MMRNYHTKIIYTRLTLLVVAFASIVGCGDDGPKRRVVTGAVTWKGQPVPSGFIYFDPDVSKGNRGPQGFTRIKDGQYDTRAELSKGCVSGPHIVTVSGFDGKDIQQFRNYGDPLFEPYKMEIDIPVDGGEINLTIPDSATPAANQSIP